MSSLGTSRRIRAIYALGFLFSLHMALPAYVNSTFLAGIIGESRVGLVYTVGSLATLIAFLPLAALLRRFGDYRILLALAIGNIALFTLLATIASPAALLIFFVISLATLNIIVFCLDVLFENYSANETTGGNRGIYLSAGNTAWLIAPLIAGFILTDSDYFKIYFITAAILIPMLFILVTHFKNFRDGAYRALPLLGSIRGLARHENTTKIIFSNFILQSFFAWMVIYTPVYLHNTIGFSWSEIGVIFTVMLLPFVLLEAPLGRLADARWGEKEMLAIGFVVMAVFTMLISFLHSTDMALWAALLFLTRVGASMVEIMNETYFFKKNDARDADVIRLFRITRPLAYLVTPLVATLVLALIPMQWSFAILGLLTLAGLYPSMTIKDTR